MVTVPTDPKDIVSIALEYEAEGHRILSEASEKSTDPLSKATFHFLAGQEIKHMETIRAFAASQEGAGEFAPDALGAYITVAMAKPQIMGIFADFKAKYEATAGDEDERLAVYKVAMNMEIRGHDFYGMASDQATDEAARKIYRFLSDEEAQHYMIIQDTHDFLQQPDAFMAVEERWMQI